MATSPVSLPEQWPSLPLEAWSDTYATLHLWTQIVGKIRLAQSPWLNHSWHVTLYVTARGLTTSPIPHGARTFQIDFDFIDHQLTIQSSDGRRGALPLAAPVGGGVLRAPDGRAGQARSPGPDLQEAQRSRGPHSLRSRRRAQERTTRSTPTDSGACSCRPTGSSRRSARASSASAAPCTSSGAPPIWRSPGSPGEGLPSIRVEFRTCPTG